MHGRRDRAALDELHPLGARVARRRRIDDAPAADRRVGAQHDVVAARRDDRLREPELRPALADAHDAREHGAGAVVDDARAAGSPRAARARRRAGSSTDTRPARRARRRAGARVRSMPGSATATRCPASARSTALVVHLHAAHAHRPRARLGAQLVALADRARPERPRGDGADAAQREHAVDVEPRRARRGRALLRPRGRRERGTQLVEPRARARAHRDDRRAGHELLRLRARELERLLVDEVGLRQRDDAALDAEQAQDREVLERLRPRALGRVDDEQEEVDAGRAGDHRADEPLVPGDVDDGELRAVGQFERRVAEVDRDAALALLRQPVGVLARQRLDERRLAVVDVTGGADRQRHAHHGGRDLLDLHRRRASGSPAAASRRARRRRPAVVPARSGTASDSSTAQAKLGSSASGRAPPPTRPTVSSTVPPTSDASRSARARTVSASCAQHAQHGDPLGRVEIEAQRSLERRERQLVRAHRPLQRMAPQLLDEVGASDDDAGLRPAEQLVAREADEVGAGGERFLRRRLAGKLDERARAQVVDERQPMPARDRGELFELRLLREADDAEVGLVHAQQQRRVRPDRLLVVLRPRAVRRPDLDEARAGPREHVGDAEAVADLDQLAARDDRPRDPRRAPRARAAPRRRCCSRRAPPRHRSAGAGARRRGLAASRASRSRRSSSRFE